MWQEVVCAPIVPCAVQFSCLRLLFLSLSFSFPVSFSFASSSSAFSAVRHNAGTWAHGAWQASTSTSVCTRCLASGAACYLGPRGGSQTARRGRSGGGADEAIGKCKHESFSENPKAWHTLQAALAVAARGGVARATGLAAPPPSGTANHWRKLSSLWPNTITEASVCVRVHVCVCVSMRSQRLPIAAASPVAATASSSSSSTSWSARSR